MTFSRFLLIIFICLNPIYAEEGGLPPVKRDNDGLTILYGNAFIQQLQENGTLEAALHASEPEKHIQYRSMAYSGDQVHYRIRAAGFRKHMQYLLAQWQADRVIMGFGSNEAYHGKEWLPTYREKLDFYLELIKERHPGAELILLSPVAAEEVSHVKQLDLAGRNANLKSYTEVMKEVAEEKGVRFIDLYAPTKTLYASVKENLTYDGMHLNETGSAIVGELIAQKITGKKGDFNKRAGFTALKKLVSRKAEEIAQAYHPSNGVHYYGVRAREYEYHTEIPHHLKLANQLDEAIWAQADDLNLAHEMPTLEVLEIQVETQKPKNGYGQIKGAEEDLKDFTVAPGFQVNCFASSEQFPELVNPLQINFDSQGRLWVTCYASYPHPLPGVLANDSILILEDTDGDGKADKKSVFADGLELPDGFTFYRDGILVSEDNRVVYLADKNADGRADYKEEILRGLDNTDTHHSGYLNRTPQGDLILSEALFHRGQFEALNGVLHTKDTSILTLDMDTRFLTVERQTSAPNPWRISYNRLGESAQFFGGGQLSDNDIYNVWTPMGLKAPSSLDNIFRYDKGVSVQYVDSPHFPKDWQGGLLTSHLLRTNEVNYTPIHLVDGAYRAAGEKITLIQSRNKIFRPSDLSFGLDGGLYISDFYYPIIGHAQHSNREKARDKANGRIWRITKKESPLVKVPKFQGASPAELISLLKDPFLKVRQLARIELEKLPSREVLPSFQEALKGADVNNEDVLEILWLAERLDQFQHVEFYKALLTSENINVQRAAVRSLRWWAPFLDQAGKDLLLDLAKHPDERIKILLVGALSYLNDEQGQWAMISNAVEAKGKETPLATALIMSSKKNKPGISPEFPILRPLDELFINKQQWAVNEEDQKVLYFYSNKARDIIIGHENASHIDITVNDKLILSNRSKHTQESQSILKVHKGINKVEYRLVNNKSLDGRYFLSTTDGKSLPGKPFIKNKEQAKEWMEEYKQNQNTNWKSLAQTTFQTHCANCHDLEKLTVGPPLKGLYGKTQAVIYADGSRKTVKVDEDYIREAILNPTSVYPEGTVPGMAKIPLSEKEVETMVKWIKSL